MHLVVIIVSLGNGERNAGKSAVGSCSQVCKEETVNKSHPHYFYPKLMLSKLSTYTFLHSYVHPCLHLADNKIRQTHRKESKSKNFLC